MNGKQDAEKVTMARRRGKNVNFFFLYDILDSAWHRVYAHKYISSEWMNKWSRLTRGFSGKSYLSRLVLTEQWEYTACVCVCVCAVCCIGLHKKDKAFFVCCYHPSDTNTILQY